MDKNKKKLTVLFDSPPPYGGVRVSANITYTLLHQKDEFCVESCPFVSSRENLLSNLYGFYQKTRRSDGVIFQIGNIFSLFQKRALLYLIIARISCKPLAYRGFAGGLSRQYDLLNPIKKLLLRKLLANFKLITFQTKKDFDFFSNVICKRNCKITWFPNTRECSSVNLPSREKAVKFCFIGKISKEKGVDLIIEISSELPENVTVDLFGPITPEYDGILGSENGYFAPKVRYSGTIKPELVARKIKDYDALLLPTTWKTEGHPGVILEALSVGVPVIATRWNGIPEVIDESCGILIEPNSKDDLLNAIKVINHDSRKWQEFRLGAISRTRDFDAGIWHERLTKCLEQMVNN